MVDWEFHSGKSVPKIDGIVVCEEYVHILREVWEQEQALKEEEMYKKRQRKTLLNWRRMVKGILLRHRLRQLYKVKEPQPGNETTLDEDTFNHTHTFPDEKISFDEKSQQWRKKCPCGFEITFEKL